MIRLFYGSGKTYIDVTAEALNKCVSGDSIYIPRGDTGSQFFPDPLPGLLKNIIVLRQNGGVFACENYSANEEIWVPLNEDGRTGVSLDWLRLESYLDGSGLSLDTDYDLLVYCEQASHWQNVAGAVEHFMREYPDLKVGLIASYRSSSYPEARYPANLPFKDCVPLGSLPLFRSKVLLTPYVGLPMPIRPAGSQVVHALVSFASLEGVYERSMFDGYDYILCAGPHHLKEFGEWAQSRQQLGGKVLLPAGYPKLDLVTGWFSSPEKVSTGEGQITVLYAPTHVYSANERFCSLRDHGGRIVAALLEAGHRVIFRPHPNSFEDSDVGLVKGICAEHGSNPNFSCDTSKEYRTSFSESDLVVTDLSGTGFTFSLSLGRPAIFFAANADAEVGLTGIQFTDREFVGGVARGVPQLLRMIETMDFQAFSARIAKYKNTVLFNPGKSSQYIAEAITHMLRDEVAPEWIAL